MKIVCAVRTHNEEELLPLYLANRPYADEIIIADDHSTDRTCEIAAADPRVRLYHYDGEPFLNTEGMWFAYEARHLQFLMSRVSTDVDWIEWVDVDEVLNLHAQSLVRDYLEHLWHNTDAHALAARFLYLANFTEYYPDPSQHRRVQFWRSENLPIFYAGPAQKPWEFTFDMPREEQIVTAPPAFGHEYLLLHLNWAYQERFMRKVPVYCRIFGYEFRPLDQLYGRREPLPEDAVWKGISKE